MRTLSTSKLNTPTTTFTATSITCATRSPWHSTIPYLFGGLAAMLGLIVVALLLLACSYRRISDRLQNQVGNHRDLEKEGDHEKKEPVKAYEEKILVIMAGDENPTFLATPVCPKSLSFGDGLGNDLDKNLGNREDCDQSEKQMDNNHDVVVGATTTPQENEGAQESRK